MPFWLCVGLSLFLSTLGLAAMVSTQSRAPGLGPALLVQAGVLVLVASSAELGRLDGDAFAMLSLLVLPVFCVLARRSGRTR